MDFYEGYAGTWFPVLDLLMRCREINLIGNIAYQVIFHDPGWGVRFSCFGTEMQLFNQRALILNALFGFSACTVQRGRNVPPL